jgi:peptide deformylase
LAIRNILTQDRDGDFLAKTCRPVDKFDRRLGELLDDMTETLHTADGVGLAAIQVGILRRVVVIDTYDGTGVRELVNPAILESDGEQESMEGCLSVPGKWGITKRPKHVRVRAQDRNGKTFEYDGEDLLATVSCHEIDHLDGHLFLSHVIRMLTDEEVEKMSAPTETERK